MLHTTSERWRERYQQADLFRDPKMLQRFQDIAMLPEKEKECLLVNIDHFIKAAKISLM